MQGHYVPRIYLRCFADINERVGCLFKRSGCCNMMSIKKICTERDMYVKFEGGRRDIGVEAAFAEFESKELAETLKNVDELPFLVMLDGAQCVYAELKEKLSRIITIQLIRGKQVKDFGAVRSEHLYHSMYDEIDRLIGEFNPVVLEKLKSSESEIISNSPIVAMEQYLDGSAGSAIPKAIMAKKCAILKIDSSAEFVTSDNPVLLCDEFGLRVGLLNVPLGDNNVIICYPVSPKVAIAFSSGLLFSAVKYKDGSLIRLGENEEWLVKRLNYGQYHQAEQIVIARNVEVLQGLKRMGT